MWSSEIAALMIDSVTAFSPSKNSRLGSVLSRFHDHCGGRAGQLIDEAPPVDGFSDAHGRERHAEKFLNLLWTGERHQEDLVETAEQRRVEGRFNICRGD